MSSQNSLPNASLSSNPVATSTKSSSVRSRPRRLVSFMDDEDDTAVNKASHSAYDGSQQSSTGLSTTLSTMDTGTTRSRGATPSPLSSRGASPLPMKHPSRVTESSLRGRNESTSLGWNGVSKVSSSRGATDFLDSPWSSLQSLASSVLGSDTGRNQYNNAAKSHTRRKPSRSDVYIRSIPRSQPSNSAWGPSAPSTPDIGVGTKEERQALVQAKKREALLLAECDPIMNRSSRHKRRDSGDYHDQQPIEPEQEEEALAYIHPVAATDSITGVTIKYGCQAAIFRKANGFWPNDNIQSRKTVLLPVDACTVKGRPIRPASNVDLLSNDAEDPSDSSIAPAATERPSTDDNPPDSCDAERNRIWKHESWVQIEGFPAAIEIGRVPRRSLGFFPRTRRKSVSYTDAEPVSSFSQDLTRSPSPAGSPQVSLSQGILPRIRTNKDNSKPSGAYPGRPQHRRQRSSLHLSGTGVGSLDRSSTAPGSAMDGLSKFFSQHMPLLAPPTPPPNLRRSSFGSESTVASNASGLENIGGALEGWVRKVAARTKAGINELQQGSPNQQAADRGRSTGLWGVGDLIEMDDTSEGRQSPSPLGTRRTEQQNTSSSSSYRATTTSASATSRSRATGLGSGPSGYGDREKDD
ncbi:hypothetical protein N7532_009241 [Penicillium argentinense]|uniref:LysM domain-containing protein n=1 Tax=Penicillium argentinense TaxID=1131581 RepID=A0A9W9K3A2_9EURO|nr:uncharacterized protein N7532_009241 [Penicillium argentinense]KAJ5090557.1 hypothetical protein N7532_009241 [Penicillium argentinense]